MFKKAPRVGADGYQRTTVRGYIDKGKVAKMLGDGWEIESIAPVQVGGNTLKQGIYLLKRKAS